jgi:hypothetical protein
MTADKVMYGTHAIQVTVTLSDGSQHQQWFCGKCKRIWGRNDKHMASWCCCTHVVCECGKEHSKSYTRCDDCRNQIGRDKWYAKPEVQWNGEWPLALADDDTYFWDSDSLLEYLDDMLYPDVEEAIAALRLTSCHQQKPERFDVNEYCSDLLAEDAEVPNADSISDRINLILDEIGTVSWMADSVRLNVRQVLESIGYGSPASE